MRRFRKLEWVNDEESNPDRLEPDPKFGPYCDAREWFAANQHEMPFARKRFRSRDEAQAFVERFYSLGAHRVMVGNIVDDAVSGGQYADLVVVDTPMLELFFEVPFNIEKFQEKVQPFVDVFKKEFRRLSEYEASSPLLYFWWG